MFIEFVPVRFRINLAETEMNQRRRRNTSISFSLWSVLIALTSQPINQMPFKWRKRQENKLV